LSSTAAGVFTCPESYQPKEPTLTIQIGDRVTNTINGFGGIAYGIAEYLTGCQKVCVMPEALDKDGKVPDSKWFDIDMLRVVATRAEIAATAGARPEPTAPGGPDDYGAPSQ
jgi:hypothetical protein